MTVAELIEVLQKAQQDARVQVYNNFDDTFVELCSVLNLGDTVQLEGEDENYF